LGVREVAILDYHVSRHRVDRSRQKTKTNDAGRITGKAGNYAEGEQLCPDSIYKRDRF